MEKVQIFWIVWWLFWLFYGAGGVQYQYSIYVPIATTVSSFTMVIAVS
jgi:hypothetical protein